MISKVLLEDIEENVNCYDYFSFFKDEKVLVTGATGLIGSNLIRNMVAANKRYGLNLMIYGQVRSMERANRILEDIIGEKCLYLIEEKNFEFEVECSYIIHTASPTKSKYFVEYPVETINDSVISTKKMLELARRNRVKNFIYISSMEEYGNPYNHDGVTTEDDIGYINHLNIRSCYPQSKRICECMCMAYKAEYGVNCNIVRLAQTFGAGVPLSDNRVFMQFARAIINKENIILHTTGKSLSNFCYVSDAVLAIFKIMNEGISGEVYNVCNDKETRSIRDIAEMLITELSNHNSKVIIELPSNDQNMGYAQDVKLRLSSAKLMNIGWQPRVSMKEAYKRLIQYLCECENNGD